METRAFSPRIGSNRFVGGSSRSREPHLATQVTRELELPPTGHGSTIRQLFSSTGCDSN